MTVFDLRQQLAQALAAGAEDHDEVLVAHPVTTLYVNFGDHDTVLETDQRTEDFRPERLMLERNGRREIWLR